MAEITLAAEAGRPAGSGSARRLRAEGKVPGVIYGHGMDPVPVAVEGRELRRALTTAAGLNALLSLNVGDKSHLALAREIQRHPVRGTVTHVDFLIVRRDEVVSAEVPVTLVGDAIEVHRAEGVIEQQLFSLGVKATPEHIPSSIEVDISGLTVGDAIRVGDLRLPTGVSADVNEDEVVVIAQPPAVTAAPEAEAAEGAAEGAAADGEPVGGAAAAGAEAQAGESSGGSTSGDTSGEG